MAAGTVTNMSPPDTAAGLTLEGVLVFAAGPYTGSGSVTEVQIQITATADTGFAAALYDSGLRTLDSRKFGAIWAEVFPAIIGRDGLDASTVYRWRMRTRNNAVETSSWSTAFTFTTDAAAVSLAGWRACQ